MFFSFARDKAFIIDSFSSGSDQFKGKLTSREPGTIRRRMIQIDFESNGFGGDLDITAYCPKVKTEDQSNLVCLYRLGRSIAHKLSTLKYIDRILDFVNGKIVEDGDLSSLLREKRKSFL